MTQMPILGNSQDALALYCARKFYTHPRVTPPAKSDNLMFDLQAFRWTLTGLIMPCVKHPVPQKNVFIRGPFHPLLHVK